MAARELWRSENYDEAIREMQIIIDSSPTHEVAEFATNIVLDSLIHRGPDLS